MTAPSVEGIADGRAEDGSFVRTFWFWNLDVPETAKVTARIMSHDYAGNLLIELAEQWVSEAAGDEMKFPMAHHYLTMPTAHVDSILLAIDHLRRQHS